MKNTTTILFPETYEIPADYNMIITEYSKTDNLLKGIEATYLSNPR